MAETATPPKAEEAPSYAEYFAETPVASIPGEDALRFIAHVDGYWHPIRLSKSQHPEDLKPFVGGGYHQTFIMCEQREGVSLEAAYFEGMIRLMLRATIQGWEPSHVRFMGRHPSDGKYIGRCFLAGPKAGDRLMKVGDKCPVCGWEEQVAGQHEPGGAHCWLRIRMMGIRGPRRRIQDAIEALLAADKALAQAEAAAAAASGRSDLPCLDERAS